MERNMSQKILQLSGEEFTPPLTLGHAVFAATSTAIAGDDKLDVTSKLRLYKLAQMGYGGGVVTLTGNDIDIIKTRVASLFTSYIVLGRVIEALETDPVA